MFNILNSKINKSFYNELLLIGWDWFQVGQNSNRRYHILPKTSEIWYIVHRKLHTRILHIFQLSSEVRKHNTTKNKIKKIGATKNGFHLLTPLDTATVWLSVRILLNPLYGLFVLFFVCSQRPLWPKLHPLPLSERAEKIPETLVMGKSYNCSRRGSVGEAEDRQSLSQCECFACPPGGLIKANKLV